LFYWSRQRLNQKARYLFFICLWIAFEKLHLNWGFSWPWLNLGNAFSESIYWIQWYEYTGVSGGSLWVLITNISLYNVLKKYSFKYQRNILIQKLALWLLWIAFPIIFSLAIYFNVPFVPNSIKVLLIQPNIDPYQEKYLLTNIDYLDVLNTLTEKNLDLNTNYIITPETFFSEGSGVELESFNKSILHNSLQMKLKEFPNTQLISGIQLYNLYQSKKPPTNTANYLRKNLWVDYYNSAISEEYDNKYKVYHKSKLVPGVETLPFKSLLNPITGSLLLNLGGTVATRVTQKYRANFIHSKIKTKAAPIICYESIYGSYVSDYVKSGANFLAIISNDAWWGNTEGHKQLFSISKLRAIENRRDLVRSANTGISGIINAKGEVISSLKYGVKGFVKGEVSSRNKITFYTKYDDIISRWSILILILLFLLGISGRIRSVKD